MNMILFDKKELQCRIPIDDPRIIHMKKILGFDTGDEFDAGIIGGLRGRGKVEFSGSEGWTIRFIPGDESPPPYPVTLVVGCPRPPVARRLLKDMSAMGVKEIRITNTELNEKSYLQAKLWREGLWRNALIEGAMQGGSTHLPSVLKTKTLRAALENLPDSPACGRFAFDNGEKAEELSLNFAGRAAVIAIGPERGWTDSERRILNDKGFVLSSLGKRILRTETACAAALGITCFLLRKN